MFLKTKSADMADKTTNFDYVCIVGTVYALLLYLISSELEKIKSTYFFFGDGIAQSVRERFEHYSYYSTKKTSGWEMAKRRFNKIRLRFFPNQLFPFLKTSKIYAQDHLYFAPLLIQNRSYTLIEDGLNWFSIHMREESLNYQRTIAYQNSLKGKFQSAVLGPLSTHPFGMSGQCKEILLSAPDDTPFLKNKKVSVCDMSSAWENATVEKREYLLSKFGVTAEDIETIGRKSIILFTQPLFSDNILTQTEHFEVYNKIISEFPAEDIIIKTHPRDKFPYQQYFPSVGLFDKPVPMELLSMAGVRFKKAVTICSTVVYTLPYKLDIIWVGSNVHPKIYDFFGDDTNINKK